MEPAINAMASKYTDVDFVKIDVDELSVSDVKISIGKIFHWSICGDNSHQIELTPHMLDFVSFFL